MLNIFKLFCLSQMQKLYFMINNFISSKIYLFCSATRSRQIYYVAGFARPKRAKKKKKRHGLHGSINKYLGSVERCFIILPRIFFIHFPLVPDFVFGHFQPSFGGVVEPKQAGRSVLGSSSHFKKSLVEKAILVETRSARSHQLFRGSDGQPDRSECTALQVVQTSGSSNKSSRLLADFPHLALYELLFFSAGST